MTIQTAHGQDMKRLGELIMDIKTAMFTTVDKAGRLHSRPMATVQCDFQGDLWFFTKDSSFRTEEVSTDHRVLLSYVGSNGHTYVTVNGVGEVSKDRLKMAELWSPLYLAWFPKGLEEADMALIKVSVHEAEYWDAPTNTVVKLANYIKALATGSPIGEGDHHLVVSPPAVEEPPKAPLTPELETKLQQSQWFADGGSSAKPPAPTQSAEDESNVLKSAHSTHEAKPPRNPMSRENAKKSHKGRKHA